MTERLPVAVVGSGDIATDLVELGARTLVGGQEDQLVDLAVQLQSRQEGRPVSTTA